MTPRKRGSAPSSRSTGMEDRDCSDRGLPILHTRTITSTVRHGWVPSPLSGCNIRLARRAPGDRFRTVDLVLDTPAASPRGSTPRTGVLPCPERGGSTASCRTLARVSPCSHRFVFGPPGTSSKNSYQPPFESLRVYLAALGAFWTVAGPTKVQPGSLPAGRTCIDTSCRSPAPNRCSGFEPRWPRWQ
jgi:hypothetical protein